MSDYKEHIRIELEFWKRERMQQPSRLDKMTDRIQKKVNSYIPDPIHKVITVTIKTMLKAVLLRSEYTTSVTPPVEMSLLHREALVRQKIEDYGKTGAAEGGITGAVAS